MKYFCQRFGRVLGCALIAACGLWLTSSAARAPAAELWVGAATADITPDRPIPLTGGTSVRIGREIKSRLTANVLALESRDGQQSLDQAILVACDLCVIRPGAGWPAIAGSSDPGRLRSVRDPAGDSRRIPQTSGRPTSRLRRQQAVSGRHAHPRGAGASARPVR